MWDEDPRYQQCVYRFLVGVVAFGVVGGFLESFLLIDWDWYLAFLKALALILAALCIYAAVIWLAWHSGIKIWAFLKNLKRG